jgi:hypothetical protein
VVDEGVIVRRHHDWHKWQFRHLCYSTIDGVRYEHRAFWYYLGPYMRRPENSPPIPMIVQYDYNGEIPDRWSITDGENVEITEELAQVYLEDPDIWRMEKLL